MQRNVLWASLLLIALPQTAYAGEFPGLVETILAVLLGIALVLGFLTEGLLAFRQHRKMHWLRGLGYTLLWMVVIYLVIGLKRT
jgi:hypothetical protein